MTAAKTICDLEFVRREGKALSLDLHLPAAAAGPVPVIVGIPGGGWRQTTRKSVPLFLADHGFALACVDYRGSETAKAPANLLDCKAAVRWLRVNASHYQLDAARIGAYGASAGGHLAALLGCSADVSALETEAGDPPDVSSAVQAVCEVCGPTDLTRCATPEMKAQFPLLVQVTEEYLGGPVREHLELARLVSPFSHVSPQTPPMLLIHGAVDAIVPFAESEIFQEALSRAGVPSRLWRFANAGHSWLVEQTEAEIAAFFHHVFMPDQFVKEQGTTV